MSLLVNPGSFPMQQANEILQPSVTDAVRKSQLLFALSIVIAAALWWPLLVLSLAELVHPKVEWPWMIVTTSVQMIPAAAVVGWIALSSWFDKPAGGERSKPLPIVRKSWQFSILGLLVATAIVGCFVMVVIQIRSDGKLSDLSQLLIGNGLYFGAVHFFCWRKLLPIVAAKYRPNHFRPLVLTILCLGTCCVCQVMYMQFRVSLRSLGLDKTLIWILLNAIVSGTFLAACRIATRPVQKIDCRTN
jgi:hypothetical protein